MTVSEIVTPEEIEQFNQRSNWKGARAVVTNWVAIMGIFAGVALWTNPLTILIGICLLAGRQLGFAALMHDAGHRRLFANNEANDFVGQWLCSYPVLSDMPRYMKGHLRHHVHAGTKQDPDLPNYANYPVSAASLRRKIWRDLKGQTGWKAVQATWRRGKADLGKAPWNGNALAGHLILGVVMWGALALTGNGLLYLMWPAAFMTFYMLFARLRQVAEHGAVPDLYDLDPRENTRTVYVRWWEKPFLAPFDLNYHLEHHLSSSVPCYNLKAFHGYLKEKGVYDDADFPRGYMDLFQRVALS